MGRRLGETYRRIGVSVFPKRRELGRDLLVTRAVSRSSLPGRRHANTPTPIRRHASPADGPF